MNPQNCTDGLDRTRTKINHVPRAQLVLSYVYSVTTFSLLFPWMARSISSGAPCTQQPPPWSWSSTSQRRAWDWRRTHWPRTKLCLCLQGLITLDFHMLCYLNYAIYMKKVISRHIDRADHTLMGRYLCTQAVMYLNLLLLNVQEQQLYFESPFIYELWWLPGLLHYVKDMKLAGDLKVPDFVFSDIEAKRKKTRRSKCHFIRTDKESEPQHCAIMRSSFSRTLLIFPP